MLVCICIYTHIWWYMLSWHHQDCPCSNDFIPFFFIGDYSVYSPPQRWLHFTCETSLEIRTEITNGICVCVCVCVCVCNLYMLTRPRTPPAQRLPRSMYVCICIYIYIYLYVLSIYLWTWQDPEYLSTTVASKVGENGWGLKADADGSVGELSKGFTWFT
jgi:hypothetical protein